MIGMSGVGKTSLFQKFIQGTLKKDIGPTIGLEYSAKELEIKQNNTLYKIRAKVWDTAGQERYKAVTSV